LLQADLNHFAESRGAGWEGKPVEDIDGLRQMSDERLSDLGVGGSFVENNCSGTPMFTTTSSQVIGICESRRDA